MQYIKLLAKIHSSINRIQRNFIWGSTSDKKKLHMVNWDTVTKTKEQGGLGIQKSEYKNKALHSSLYWRLYHNPNSLWGKTLISKYSKSDSDWRKKPSSRIWGGVLEGWRNCINAHRWVVHKGNRANFFHDFWLPHTNTTRSMIHGPLQREEDFLKVSDLHDNGDWMLQNLSISLLDNIIGSIHNIHLLPNSTREDQLVWGLTKNGNFTTNSAYMHIHNSLHNASQDMTTKEFQWIWRANCPNKIKNFLWLLNHFRLPTGNYLHKMGIELNQSCHFCDHPQEDINYIFFQCPNARDFWNEISVNSLHQLHSQPHALTMANWRSLWKNTKGKIYNAWLSWDDVLPFCFWGIWLQRNDNLFNKRKNIISHTHILSLATEYHLLIDSNPLAKPQRTTVLIKWTPPPVNCFVLNTDGSANLSTGVNGIGGVIRDWRSDWKLGFNAKIPSTNSVMTELMALRMGLSLAKDHNLSPILIQLDSIGVIDMFSNENTLYSNFILECMSLMQELRATAPTHIFREQNKVADLLSKEEGKCQSFDDLNILIVPPVYAAKALWADIAGTMYSRKISGHLLNFLSLSSFHGYSKLQPVSILP